MPIHRFLRIGHAVRAQRGPGGPLHTGVLVAMLALAVSSLTAQALQPPDAVRLESQPTPGWTDAFVFQSPDGDYRLQVGALVQVDGRFALDDDRNAVSTFAVRRLRPYIRGRLAQRFEFYLNPDFAGGTLVVQDAYLDTRFSPALIVRVGKAKVPFGLERLVAASSLLFFERALPSALVPNRDVGVQALGDLAGGRVSYAAGVFNGVADGASADTDSNGSKDVAGRLAVKPFLTHADTPLSGIGVAIAGTSGRQTTLPSFRTPSLQQTFFSHSGVSADGRLTRYSPQAFYYYKRVAALAEYVHSQQPVRKDALRDDTTREGWQIAGSYLLTRDVATERGVRPRTNFDFGHGHVGALQIAARYHTLRVDPRSFARRLASAGSSLEAKAWTIGLNWYLNPYFKYVVNFERVVFDRDAAGGRRTENALAFRTQASF